jgi:hypothetical protein
VSELNFGFINDTQKTALEEIESHTLYTVDGKYSTGYPNYQGCSGEAWLYHNGYHARSVGKGALEVLRALGASPDTARIGELAGYAHDIYQGNGHEGQSAEWLEAQLRQKGLPKPVAQMAGLAIRGTKPLFADGVIVGQMATRQRYPSHEAKQVGLAVASADLGTLYAPEGPMLAHDLYREIHSDVDPAIDESLLTFQKQQMELLAGYLYPLPQAEKVFATHRPQVMQYSEYVLDQLERGDIENWQQLRRQDEAFYRKHS